MMRRGRTPPASPSPFRALAHHHAATGGGPGGGGGGQQPSNSVSSLLRSFNVETNPTRPMRPSPLTASTISDMPLDLVDRIRSFPLFLTAPDDFLVAIGRHLRPQVHAAHDHILTEGDEAKAMYWLVRGVVAVTSRDGEAVYAELKPGAFFGEIGVLMNIPRTATIIARTKCLLVVLKREDLHAELPQFPEMEQAIRQEAQERLAMIAKKRREMGVLPQAPAAAAASSSSMGTSGGGGGGGGGMIAREAAPGEVSTGNVGVLKEGVVVKTKKRKSPSPTAGSSALGSGIVNVRTTLMELPLFSTLPNDILHSLGLGAQPKTYPPFTDIIQQGTPGNEIFFIVRGEAEVIVEKSDEQAMRRPLPPRATRSLRVRPRLKQGQYFGEVSSLGLSKVRMATVRSITTVECLIIAGEALNELWERAPPELRRQVEETARTRYAAVPDGGDVDVDMLGAAQPITPTKQPALPAREHDDTQTPSDPDPYLSVDMENLRNRRRASLAPLTPQSDTSPGGMNGSKAHAGDLGSPLKFIASSSPPPSPFEDYPMPIKRPRTNLPRRPHQATADERQTAATVPDEILVSIFSHLDLTEMIRLRLVSTRYRRLLSESPRLCLSVDLCSVNRKVTDAAVVNVLAPFIGERPREIDISNCFHLTDQGFEALWRNCGRNVKVWKMRSVWDVSAGQILDMSENAKGLVEVDWSNCRKVGDNLLARVVGWIVPEPPPQMRGENGRSIVVMASSPQTRGGKRPQQQQPPPPPQTPEHKGGARRGPPPHLIMPPPGTVVGCPGLRRLNLSYCKHITDRSMAHLAAHASNRLESLTLTRCTSITDAGFQSWVPYRFSVLRHLCLADCTYLSDNSIIALVNAAKNLTHLDLSFCCALSDTATEVVALGLPMLRELRMAFCGSAVSDASLGCIALHLNELRGLSVRGCVRVTGVGVENVLEGCGRLEWIDVSQCKNLAGWLVGGGVARWGFDARGPASAPSHMAWQMPSARLIKPASQARGGKMGPGAVGGGLAVARSRTGRTLAAAGTGGPGPMMRPVVPPPGASAQRTRKPVRFLVEKGAVGLR